MTISNFRASQEEFHLLATTERTQTATMTLPPGAASDEGFSTHEKSDQTVVLLEGELVAEVGDERAVLKSGETLIVPAGMPHRFSNQADAVAFAFTTYAPPAYPADGDET